jgi:hypothetical protein
MDTQAHDVTMKTLSLPAILLCSKKYYKYYVWIKIKQISNFK